MGAPRRRTETHCANGHPWEGNLYISPYDGGVHCRTCNNDAQIRWKQRNGHGRAKRAQHRVTDAGVPTGAGAVGVPACQPERGAMNTPLR